MASPENKHRALIWIAAISLALAILLFGIWLCGESDETRVDTQQRELQDLFHGNPASGTALFGGTALAEGAQFSVERIASDEFRTISDSFVELYEINPDVIGWIEGGGMDTAVVYRDNEYYLDHDFYGAESKGGTVFADEKNSDWENDSYVVLYGHNMKNGSMFASLKAYRDTGYLRQNPILTFHSVYDNVRTEYVPYALLDASMDADNADFFNLRNFDLFDFGNLLAEALEIGEKAYVPAIAAYRTEVQAYLDEPRARSFFAVPGLEVTPDDRVLVLVTCSYELENARMMLFCRALRPDETAEQMAALIRENAIG